MAKYKVTKVYEVEASNKAEAMAKVEKDPESLKYVTAYLLYDVGLAGELKRQLFGFKK